MRGAFLIWRLELRVQVFFNSHNLALSCVVNLSLLATSLATQGNPSRNNDNGST